MEFPKLEIQCGQALACLEQFTTNCEQNVRFAISPLRICPLGAHIDHQGGPVLGMAINARTVLAFAPNRNDEMILRSLNFSGETHFRMKEINAAIVPDWGKYAVGAVQALREFKPIRRGFIGAVNGVLIGSGLSSSASVGLAYLQALAAANVQHVEKGDLVELDRCIENDYLGLKNGILDPATIVYGLKNHLVYIDTMSGKTRAVQSNPQAPAYRILIAYSGYTRQLLASGFNHRVEECWEAAKQLAEKAKRPNAQILSDIPKEVFEENKNQLPEALARRARHYYSEVWRVEKGLRAWENGDMKKLGELMNASCHSSIVNYECGSPSLKALHEIMSATRGIYGSRFSGGGYGGCVVGFVREEDAENAASQIEAAYHALFPKVRDNAKVYFAESDDGLRLERI